MAAVREDLWGKGKMYKMVTKHLQRKSKIKDVILQGGPGKDCYFFECNAM